LLHPISFDEPFGLSVIEAMACGTPVIAFNRGSMSELIRDGINGYLVSTVAEAADAIGRLGAIDRGDCRKWVDTHFSVERMVDDYIKVYEDIIEQTKAGGSQALGILQDFRGCFRSQSKAHRGLSRKTP